MMKQFKQISDYHKLAGLKAPLHPLISVVDYEKVSYPDNIHSISWQQHYYTIALKRDIPHKLFYGHHPYDFDAGVMTFIAPGQVMTLGTNPNLGSSEPHGYLLLIHPDFLWNSALEHKIKAFEFFDYHVNEALHLSEPEEEQITNLLNNIKSEYQSNIDKFSQPIIVSQIALLLEYTQRFYERQFITRRKSNSDIVAKVNHILEEYFEQEDLINKGLPKVSFVADAVHLSPNYLSNLLQAEIGESTQQIIHNKLIAKAKLELSSTQKSISEIAYLLGFEHASSFTKLFKKKTSSSPNEYRRSLLN